MSSVGQSPLVILQLSTSDVAGGSESVAFNLFRTFRDRGHGSYLGVGARKGNDRGTISLAPQDQPTISGFLYRAVPRLVRTLTSRRTDRFERFLQGIPGPTQWLHRYLGHEELSFPISRRVLQLSPQRPDIVHCHNLHGGNLPGGGYFDLRYLPILCQSVPVVVTLHDAWLFSGHCAHSLKCDRWRSGCGQCPDLNLYPAIRRDATARNWRVKKRILRTSKLHVATPCEWLMQQVGDSILNDGTCDRRVIPNGVDTRIFKPLTKPSERAKIRVNLNIPLEAKVILTVANAITSNPWKDYRTLRQALDEVVAKWSGKQLVVLMLGDSLPAEVMPSAEIRFIPFVSSPAKVAEFYQISDIYMHACRIDTFPNTILEAFACGCPVVATAVGGIPEQVNGAAGYGGSTPLNSYDTDRATGILTRPGDSDDLATAALTLLGNDELRGRLSTNASSLATDQYDLSLQADRYETWYHEILDHSRCNNP